MPYKMRKVTKKNCYKVYKPSTKKVFSKCTTKKNAIKQLRLLRAIQFNKDFVPRRNLKTNREVTPTPPKKTRKNKTRKNKTRKINK